MQFTLRCGLLCGSVSLWSLSLLRDTIHGAMRAKRYLIRGDVQGVGYRYFTKGTAERLGIKGFVRNLHTGEVEVHAEADDVTLQLFKRELECGPRMAQVTEVIEQDLPASGMYSSFLIRG